MIVNDHSYQHYSPFKLAISYYGLLSSLNSI